MQAQLFGEQLLLSSIFCTQPVPTAVAQQASEERHNAIQKDIIVEIEEKQERILELRKEIGDDEEALLNAEEDEIDAEPDEDEEVIFDAVAPMLEEDLNYTRYENEAEIKTLEDEIGELEAKLK
ncbi:MAG: hypothetical protein WA977_08515 [Halobacteriota archaeon]